MESQVLIDTPAQMKFIEINSNLSTIIVSKRDYTFEQFQKIRQNNFLVFVPHKICEDKIFGINVKLELNNVDRKYNGYMLEDIEQLNYFENFIDIHNENKAITIAIDWIFSLAYIL